MSHHSSRSNTRSSSKHICEPEKEIRFTRSSQAKHFFLLTAFFMILGIGSLLAMFFSWGPDHIEFKEQWYLPLFALIPACISLKTAIHCIRHAYLILTPMGIEIFPFFKPEKNLQVIFWQDISHVEMTSRQLKMHFNKEETAGVILSLKPIDSKFHTLLEKAIQGRTHS